MFDYFTGVVKDLGPNTVVLETGGIGYEFTASRFCINNLKLEDTVKLYSYLNVYEGGMGLFGFYSKEEKAMFLRLISISGIAAKGAIGILSGLSLNELCVAIVGGDAKALSGIKGVGKKTAERIVLELRDKLGEEFSIGADVAGGFVKGDVGEEAILALMALGFTKQESLNALKRVDTNGKTVEEIIKAALKRG
ncbi:MAG: Holliday junction branch migration protein RuvA [Clostridiales bacterium]|nr:Holliday junction branch migration protein RuvA [Clostridiales bacterium]